MKVWQKIRKPLIFTLLAVLAVSYYIYLSHRKVDNSDKTVSNSAASELISRNLDLNYPGTPIAVVSYYSEIIKVIYKETISDDETAGLAQHSLALFDSELSSYNDYETYLASFTADIAAYKSAGKYISEYTVEPGYNVEYTTFKDNSYAMVDVKYYVREGKNLVNTYEEYTLRKDKEGKWKILYWTLTDASKMEK